MQLLLVQHRLIRLLLRVASSLLLWIQNLHLRFLRQYTARLVALQYTMFRALNFCALQAPVITEPVSTSVPQEANADDALPETNGTEQAR